MSGLRFYTLETGMDTRITLHIDTSIMTEQVAADVVSFWSGGGDVLDASEGDVFEAVARFAAPCLLRYMVDGWNEIGAIDQLSDDEGWPSPLGIAIHDHELPDLDPVMFDLVHKGPVEDRGATP